MRRIREPSCWWILSLLFLTLPQHNDGHPAVDLVDQPDYAVDRRPGSTGATRERRSPGDPYWSYSGSHGPRGWAASYPECAASSQSPVDIADERALLSEEFQELVLDKFTTESSNHTTMKNTGKTVAVLLKDDYFVRGAGLPGRFKAEKMEFHWGQSNGSAGSEHSISGRRFPVEVKHPDATPGSDKCAMWDRECKRPPNARQVTEGVWVDGVIVDINTPNEYGRVGVESL